ncbi:hypothetical protein N665_7333s0001 [Sinapis alba]|nr:hypothetical protein N665_7333s0001 [Sinapis alba]
MIMMRPLHPDIATIPIRRTKDRNSDLRDHLQHRHPTIDLEKSFFEERNWSLLRMEITRIYEGNDSYDLRDHLVHVRSTHELRDPHSKIKKPVIPGDDFRNKLTTKTGVATPDLQTTLSDKRPKGDLVDIDQPHNDPQLVELQIGTCEVTRVLIDTGSSVDLIFRQTLEKMMVDLNDIKPSSRALTGFNGSLTSLFGTIRLNVFAGGVNKLVKFSVIDTKTQYNAILGTPLLHMMKAIPSTYHQCVKFPTKEGTVFTLKGNQRLARSMLISDLKSQQVTFLVEPDKKPSPQKEETVQVGIDPDYPERTIGIGSDLSDALSIELTTFLRANKSTFVWTTADMPGIDPAVTSHRLNVDPTYKPIKQKRRKLRPERAKAVNDEVDRLLGAGSIVEVKYPDWLANPVVVKKKNGKWRVCIDFTNLNKACP